MKCTRSDRDEPGVDTCPGRRPKHLRCAITASRVRLVSEGRPLRCIRLPTNIVM